MAAYTGGVWRLAAFYRRQEALEREHKAHEDVCAERYQRIEQTHALLVKTTDERHEETRDALTSIDEKLTTILTNLGSRGRSH